MQEQDDTAYFVLRTPSWRKEVSLLDSKIRAHNEVVFTEAPDKEGTWYIDGETAKTYPLRTFETKDGRTLRVRDIPERAIKYLKGSAK